MLKSVVIWLRFCFCGFIHQIWLFIDNSGEHYEIIAEGSFEDLTIHNKTLWNKINENEDGN